MSFVRKAAVAGTFYPAGPQELEGMVKSFLRDNPHSGRRPKALIAPHAGYPYSGPIAASAYSLLEPLHAIIKRVVLIGPSHRVGFRGIAVSGAEAFATPLGDVPVDLEGVQAALACPSVHEREEAHAREHGLEVHLPFLMQALDFFRIVPLVVGDATPAEVAAVLEALWGGEETLVVVSSDLSHYFEYPVAQRLDTRTSASICALAAEELEPGSACGLLAIQGLLQCARARGLEATLIDQRNSGDTAGSRDQVVGYGAYAFA